MKRLAYLVSTAAFSIVLAACTPAANTNTTVIDLVNEPTNTAAVVQQPAGSDSGGNTNVGQNTNAAVRGNTSGAANANTNTSVAVSITASGFSPRTVTVKAGTTVTWTNSTGGEVRIASDPHPTHTDLPELNSSTLASGDAYSFNFTEVGIWGYHDHLDPTTEGSVTVQ